MSKSLFDIVAGLDNFPYYEEELALFTETFKNYHALKVQNINITLGYIPNTLVQSISWPGECWIIEHPGAVVLKASLDTTTSTRTQIIEDAINKMTESGGYGILKGWCNERFLVYGPGGEVVLEIERSASARFGVLTNGVQMLCNVEDEKGFIRLWIAKHSEKKQTYPGMLDCTAAGALSVGQSPRTAVIGEATEEASIECGSIETGMRSVGSISYFHMKGPLPAVGNESASTALLLPEVEYLYELKLNQSTVPRPKDSEVEEFRLCDVDQVLEALHSGMFKPNSAVVVIDFLIRPGIVTPETEPRYLEVIMKLHRRLPFPTA